MSYEPEYQVGFLEQYPWVGWLLGGLGVLVIAGGLVWFGARLGGSGATAPAVQQASAVAQAPVAQEPLATATPIPRNPYIEKMLRGGGERQPPKIGIEIKPPDITIPGIPTVVVPPGVPAPVPPKPPAGQPKPPTGIGEIIGGLVTALIGTYWGVAWGVSGENWLTAGLVFVVMVFLTALLLWRLGWAVIWGAIMLLLKGAWKGVVWLFRAAGRARERRAEAE